MLWLGAWDVEGSGANGVGWRVAENHESPKHPIRLPQIRSVWKVLPMALISRIVQATAHYYLCGRHAFGSASVNQILISALALLGAGLSLA